MLHSKIIIVLVCLILFTQLTQTVSIKTLNKQCLCDISDQCDSQCCCDGSCNSGLISQWQNYKLCLDDNFGIPFCSKLQQTDTNILDLHSGLRTIYSVIKRLLCINAVNFVQPSDWYKKSINDQDINNQMNNINTAQSQSVVNSDLLTQTQFPISGLPLRGSNGLCRSSSQITKNNQKSSSCRVYIKDSTSLFQHPLLSINKFQAALSGSTFQIYDTKTASTGSIASQNLVTTCIGAYCQNTIRQIKIFINMNNGSIDSNSYIVVGPVNVQQTGYINIQYEYKFIKVQNNQIVFPSSSKIGYQFGSRLNLLYKDSNSNFYKIFSPINLAFRQLNGQCRTSLSSSESANSFVDIKFGQNQVISCLGTSNLIYQNLKTVFNYVGKYGVSSTKLSEYINVTLSSSISSSQSVHLIFYYINIGVPQNPQYEISKVQIKPVTIKDGLSTLYVQFISVDNQYSLYVPPAPIVDAYLPNDFLYPFFVA